MLVKLKQLLSNRKVNAGLWSIGGHGVSQIIRLGSNLILTRLLAPELFGIMAIANVVVLGLTLFSDVGLRLNIIRSEKADDPLFLNTVWSMQIIRGVLIWLIALFISSGFYVAGQMGWLTGNMVYAEPLLPIAIAAISFTSVISGFESTRLAIAVRQFSQKRILILDIISQLVGISIMIIWASIEASIWAFVAGNIVGKTFKTILSHTALPGLSNRCQWDPVIFKEVFNYGKWIFLSSVMGFLFKNGDKLLLGGMINAELLGIYSIAFMMINLIQMSISKLSAAVIFPTFSEYFRERPLVLKDTYYKFRIWLDTVILVLVGFLIEAGDLIINILYDDRYAEAGSMTKVLAFILLTQRYYVTLQYYLAIGKPQVLSLLNTISVFTLYSIVPIGFYLYDFTGALWAIVLTYFISIPVSLFLKAKHDILDVKKELISLPIIFLGVAFGKLFVTLFG